MVSFLPTNNSPLFPDISQYLVRDCKQCGHKPRIYCSVYSGPQTTYIYNYAKEYELTCKTHSVVQYNSRFHNEIKTRPDGKIPNDDILYLINQWNKYNE